MRTSVFLLIALLHATATGNPVQLPTDFPICPGAPCILPADCENLIPPNPNDPCACPTCADPPPVPVVRRDADNCRPDGMCVIPLGCKMNPSPDACGCPTCVEPRHPQMDCSLVHCLEADCDEPIPPPPGQCCSKCPEGGKPRICPLRPCTIPAGCLVTVPSPDPCGCPICVLDCSTVLCIAPDCLDPVPPPPGQCCLTCPTGEEDSDSESRCPSDRPSVDCFADPCDVTTCPAHPEATCIADFCGGCNARFFDKDGREVTDICAVISRRQTTECPIDGQVFLECGSACPPTCADPFPAICTLQCVSGCQCPSGTVLDEVANKCVAIGECTCPPDCSLEFCGKHHQNSKALCSVPGPREIPGCTGQCQLTFCQACYFSEETRDLPGNCRTCGDPVSSLNCLRHWASCIHRADLKENGKPDPSCITEEKFRCYRYPCNLRG